MADVMDLVARLILDSSEYDAGLDNAIGNAERKGNSVGSNFANGIGNGLKIAGAAITGASTALAGFGIDSVKTGQDFDQSMAQVAATMGKTVDEIGELRDFAQEMGSTTAFSASQAADALNYMALAGYDAETSMKMLPNVLNLAAAGSFDLATASDMITDAQSALGLTLDQTTEMVDKMAAASSKSNTSVAQLGEAFLTIGATARNVKGGTTELSTVLGVLADNGIKGSEGGTHLRNAILSLQTPSKAGAAALEKLGMSYEKMYDESGNMRALPEIFMEMQTAMEGMDQASKDAIISGVFNKTDLAAVNALIGTSAERWDELSAAIDDSTGAAERMAGTQLDNLAGDITLLQSAFEGAQIAISDQLTPSFRDFVQFGGEGLSKLTEAFKKDGVEGAVKQFGYLLSDLISMVLDKAPDMVKAGTQLIVALVKGLWNNRGKILNAVKEIFRAITTTLGQEFPKLRGFFEDIQNLIDGVFGFFQENETTILAALKGILAGFLAYQAVITVMQGISTAVGVVSTAMKVLSGEMAVASLINPFTAAAVGIGAVIALMVTLKEKEEMEREAYWNSLTTLTEEEQKRLDAANEYIDKLDEIYGKNRDVVQSVEDEMKPQQELREELDKIVDANGHIKQGYEERADVIITKLNDAFGTELQRQGEIITNYDTEMEKIDQLIEKKKAEALISANTEAYSQALKDQIGLFDEMSAAQSNYDTYKKAMDDAYEELLKNREELNKMSDDEKQNSTRAMELRYNIEQLKNTYRENRMHMLTYEDALTRTQQAYYANQDFIKDYNALMEASEGNTEDLAKAVERMTNGIIEDAPDEILKGQADRAIEHMQELMRMHENDMTVTEQMIETVVSEGEGAIAALEQAGVDGASAYKQQFEELAKEAEGWGIDLVDNFASGIKNKLPVLDKAADGAAKSVRSRLHFSEPDVGPLSDFSSYAPDMMDLFAQGILDNEDKVSRAVESAFDFKDAIIPTGDMSNAAVGASSGLITPTVSKPVTVVLEVDRQQFGKVVFNLNQEESQRIGVDLGRQVVS